MRELVAGTCAFLVFCVVVCVEFRSVVFGGCTVASAPHVTFTTPSGPVGYPDTRGPVPLFDPYGPGWIHEATLPFRKRVLAGGAVPHWNPHIACGNPYFAGLLPGLLFPPNAAMLLLPAPLGFDVAYLSKLLIAAMAMYVFLRAHGVGFFGAVFGGIVMQGCGYLTTGLNLSNASVECLIPLLLWAMERTVRHGRRRDVFALGVVTFFVLIGGNPESSFLAIALGAVYGVARGVALHGLGAAIGFVAKGALGGVLGAGLAAPQLVPFLEFVGLAEHAHHPGSFSQLMPWKLAAPLFFPGFFVVAHTGRELSETGGMFGIAALGWFVALWSFAGSGGRHRFLVGFGWCALIVTYLAYFGAPGVGQIGALPVFNQIHLQKYALPYLAVFPALLAGVGLHAALRSTTRWRWRMVVGGVILLAVWVFFAWLWSTGEIAAVAGATFLVRVGDAVAPRWIPFAAVVLGLVVVAWMRRRAWIGPRAVGALVVSLVTVEIALHLPTTYPERRPFYREPAFAAKLPASRDTFRVYSPDASLYPNTASVVGLNDIRYCTALKSARYSRLIETLFDDPRAHDYFPNVGDRIPLNVRALSMLAVRYCIVSKRSLCPGGLAEGRRDVFLRPEANRGSVVFEFERDASEGAASGSVDVWRLNGGDAMVTTVASFDATTDLSARRLIDMASDDVGLPYLCVWAHRGRLDLRDVTWDGVPATRRRRFHRAGAGAVVARPTGLLLTGSNIHPLPPGGRALAFSARATGGKARVALARQPARSLFRATLTPDRERARFVLDTRDWPAGPTGVSIGVRNARLTAMYRTIDGMPVAAETADTVVFENGDALPRAFGVYRTEVTVDDAVARARLVDPALDVRRVAIVSEPVPGAGSAPSADLPPPTVRWREAEPERIELDVDFAEAGALVLLDNDYPGWTCEVDGAPTPIVRANTTFRAVPVAKGTHRVVFAFRPPRLGWIVLGAILLATAGAWSQKRWWARAA